MGAFEQIDEKTFARYQDRLRCSGCRTTLQYGSAVQVRDQLGRDHRLCGACYHRYCHALDTIEEHLAATEVEKAVTL